MITDSPAQWYLPKNRQGIPGLYLGKILIQKAWGKAQKYPNSGDTWLERSEVSSALCFQQLLPIHPACVFILH